MVLATRQTRKRTLNWTQQSSGKMTIDYSVDFFSSTKPSFHCCQYCTYTAFYKPKYSSAYYKVQKSNETEPFMKPTHLVRQLSTLGSDALGCPPLGCMTKRDRRSADRAVVFPSIASYELGLPPYPISAGKKSNLHNQTKMFASCM